MNEQNERFSILVESTTLIAMSQYIHTKQRTGTRLIKSSKFPKYTIEIIKKIAKEKKICTSSLIRTAIAYQLTAMQLITKMTGTNPFPACSAASFIVKSCEIYISMNTDEERERWLRHLQSLEVYNTGGFSAK